MRNLLSFLSFQGAWFVAVEGAARGSMWAGPAAAAVVAAVHVARSARPAREIAFLLGVGLAGTLADTALHALEVTGYPTSREGWPFLFVPPWITALWLAFATQTGTSLAWLAPRPWLAALLGAVGGPLSYLAGVRIGAVATGEPAWATWVGLAVEYAVATPLLLRAGAWVYTSSRVAARAGEDR